MKLHALALATGLMMTGGAYAAVNTLGLTDTLNLGAFGAPTTYLDAFSVATPGTINHSLTFNITTPLYAGSAVSDIQLQFGSFTLAYKNITGLSAEIYKGSNIVPYATFTSAGNPDYLTLPASSYFDIGNYTLKVGGTSTGLSGGSYIIAAITTPVPEPGTWAMLLVGLGLVGLRLRLRQKAATLSQNIAA